MADLEANEGYIRARYRDLGGAHAKYVSAAPVTPLGHAEVSVSTSAVGLPSIPADCRRVVLFAVANPVTFTDTAGDSPSATHGMIIPADTVFVYDTDPDENFKLWAASSTVCRVAYYG